MATNWVQDADLVTMTAGASGSSGAVLVNSSGDFLGIAQADYTSGSPMAVVTRGVAYIAKVTGAIAAGDRLYWSASDSKVSIYDVGTCLGYAVEAAASGDTTVLAVFDTAIGFAQLNKGGKAVEWKKARFDATGGKAVGSYNLTGDFLIPTGAKITQSFFQVVTAPTSGGAATVAFGIPTDDVAGIKAATAIASWTTGAPIAGIQTAPTAATEITTAARALQADVGTADLTAGVIDLYYAYILVNE